VIDRLVSRDVVAAAGIALVAVGLAHRMAFYSEVGMVLVPLGFALLGLAALRPDGPPRAYPILLTVLCVLAALAPFDPAGPTRVEAGLTIAAPVVFYSLGFFSGGRRARLYIAGMLLVFAHAHYLLRFPHPLHQDVWTFLNGGVDLLARGHDPYQGVPLMEEGVAKTLAYTYPPGALLVLAPFRLLAGDVRWAYIVAEAVVVVLWGRWLVARGRADRGLEALVLIPLALPRTSQAFYIFSNHEWTLLALALGALLLALRGRDLIAGIVLGLGVASKQYFVVFPALFVFRGLRRPALVAAVAVVVVVTTPFLAWDAGHFLTDVLGNLAQTPDADRLTVWAALAHVGIRLPRAGLLLLAATALGITGLTAWRTRADPSAALCACGVCLALVALCSSFAAYNYYFYALVFVAWGLLLPAGLGWQRIDLRR
jgi:hypothetical protein